jgi:hypothetical protein
MKSLVIPIQAFSPIQKPGLNNIANKVLESGGIFSLLRFGGEEEGFS